RFVRVVLSDEGGGRAAHRPGVVGQARSASKGDRRWRQRTDDVQQPAEVRISLQVAAQKQLEHLRIARPQLPALQQNFGHPARGRGTRASGSGEFLENSVLRSCGWTASRNWGVAEMFYAWIGWRVEETVSALVPRARMGVWSGEPCGDSAGDGPRPDPVGKI